jgi:ABC-type bacteriocin/lantibiotic exporter with double-glycine peptidase domain
VTHFGETLSGASTIRAYKKSDEYIKQGYEKIDKNLIANFWFTGLSKWFSIRLNFLSLILNGGSLALVISFRSK